MTTTGRRSISPPNRNTRAEQVIGVFLKLLDHGEISRRRSDFDAIIRVDDDRRHREPGTRRGGIQRGPDGFVIHSRRNCCGGLHIGQHSTSQPNNLITARRKSIYSRHGGAKDFSGPAHCSRPWYPEDMQRYKRSVSVTDLSNPHGIRPRGAAEATS